MDPKDYNHPACLRAIQAWKKAGPALQAARDAEIASADTVQAIAILAELFDLAVTQHPLRASSGLVEQQKWFRRLANDQAA